MSENNKFVKHSAKELREMYDRPMERIRHMSNGQILFRVFLMFAFMASVSAGIYILLNGLMKNMVV